MKTTTVELSNLYRVTEIRKKWIIFSWFEKLSSEKLQHDMYITTKNKVDSVYLNGEKIK